MSESIKIIINFDKDGYQWLIGKEIMGDGFKEIESCFLDILLFAQRTPELITDIEIVDCHLVGVGENE